MDTIQAIKTRRSIRKFKEKDIDDDLIKTIIEAGMMAPSSKNTQPWYFIVLKGKKKNTVVDIVEEEYPKRNNIYRKGQGTKPSQLASCVLTRNAPVLILVFNKAPYTLGEDNVIKECDYESLLAWTVEVESVSAAIQNMLLALHSLGLGGVWLADFNFARKKICKYLNCKYDLLAGIALGYPDQNIPPRDIPEIKFEMIE